ncbi:hypothetical protein ACVWZA_003304 [Sphingomonas sp. UYAg733]
MAYLDINNMTAAPMTARTAANTDTRRDMTAPAGFSALEWSVIALAKRDRISSLSEPSRVSRALGGLFGLGTTSRLAEPKLETLRRLAVHAWKRGYALPASEVANFLNAGFSMSQAETLVASVTGGQVGQLAWRIAA